MMRLRLIAKEDSIDELNLLLKSAYAVLLQKGLNFSAATETVEATRKNILVGECYVGIFENQIVGTAILRFPPSDKSNPIPWFNRPEVANFGRMAVHPKYQGKKFASQILSYLESIARELGHTELALDTSENAEDLLRFYSIRGYRLISHHQWPDKVYRSVILSKKLNS